MRALLSWAKKGLTAATLLAAAMATPAQAQVTAKSDHAEGTLVFEREVELLVHASAKVGTVTGATAQAYTDKLPPRE